MKEEIYTCVCCDNAHTDELSLTCDECSYERESGDLNV